VEDTEEEKIEEKSTPEIDTVEGEEAGIIGEDDDAAEGVITMDDLDDLKTSLLEFPSS
jgi:hypothetical protein